jgi:hypothetical protein
MPTVIDTIPEPARRSPLGPAPRYDWPTIFDGRVHHFTPAEVPSTPRNFGRQVRRAAAVYGVEVRVVVRGAQGVYVEAKLG